MRLRYSLFLLFTLGLCSAARAQQPFARFGVKVKVLSLSNGRYPEFFPNDSLRRVGSVVYNRRLHRIAYLLPPDSLLGRTKSEVTSRWWVVDPHAENYVNITPYAYVANNPVNNSDPDGRDIHYNTSKPVYDKKTGVSTYHVTIDVTVKVMNSSHLDAKTFNSQVSDFRGQLQNTLAGSYQEKGSKKNYVFSAGKINVQGVSSMSQVKASDHLMVVVDDVTGKSAKGGERGGVADMSGKMAYVEPDQGASGMMHEFGHNMSLEHAWLTGDDTPGNFMGYGSNGNSFSNSQIFKSYLSGRDGLLNQGTNSETQTTNSHNSNTTDRKPFHDAKKGDVTPRHFTGQ